MKEYKMTEDMTQQRSVWHVKIKAGPLLYELTDSIEFVVVDGNERRCFCVLPQDVRLLQTEKQSINDWSSSWVCVATAASSANSMSLMRTLLTFVLALRRARLKSLPSDKMRR